MRCESGAAGAEWTAPMAAELANGAADAGETALVFGANALLPGVLSGVVLAAVLRVPRSVFGLGAAADGQVSRNVIVHTTCSLTLLLHSAHGEQTCSQLENWTLRKNLAHQIFKNYHKDHRNVSLMLGKTISSTCKTSDVRYIALLYEGSL